MRIKVKENYTEQKDVASMFTIFSLFIAAILIGILSMGGRFFFRPGVDSAFWGDLAFLSAIIIYSLYFGISESKRYYEKKPEGAYQSAVSSFKNVRNEVKQKDFTFDQWLDYFYKREKKDYYMALISLKTSYSNVQVLDLDMSEIENLRNPYKKDWSNTEFKHRKPTIFRSMTEEQLALLRKIFEGKYSFSKLPNGYFKTYDSNIALSEYKEHTQEQKKDTLYTIMLIMTRLIMLFFTQIIFAIFGIRLATLHGAQEIMENIYNTFARLFNLISGFSWGWLVGRELILRKVRKIDYKIRVNEQFLSDKAFKGIDEEELAKQEYENYQKELENESILKLPFIEEQKEATV